LQALLAGADRGDLGLGIGDAGHRVVVDVAAAGLDRLDAGHAVLLGLVGEHRARDDVADGVEALGAGAEGGVALHAAALVALHPARLQPQALGVGLAADGDQDTVGLDRVLALDLHDRLALRALAGHLDPGDLGAGAERDALLL